MQVWLLQSLIFVIEWDNCECCTSWPWPTFSRSQTWNDRKSASYDLDRCWNLPSNGIIVNVVLRDLDLHFQGQIFSCYPFAIKNCAGSGWPRQICLDSHGLVVKLPLSMCSLRRKWNLSRHYEHPDANATVSKSRLLICGRAIRLLQDNCATKRWRQCDIWSVVEERAASSEAPIIK